MRQAGWSEGAASGMGRGQPQSIKATAEDDNMQQVQLVWCASGSMLIMVMDDPPAPLLACVLPYAYATLTPSRLAIED